ncbi:hypothetical protein QRD43_02805 [Pelomonas sp. APW6]|uniref:ABC transporter permease n=1 Tax=Roseateles subflavus TaxID=3053353 RepID=A0ABT7LD86_9BURK|nr:hypothetical protein [Pelomonas sp. APW6]MDL5030824.1 hypothetical protein [Pelomonas sp. APW6]
MNTSLRTFGRLVGAPWRTRISQTSARQIWGSALGVALFLAGIYNFQGGPLTVVVAGVGLCGLLVSAWLLTLSGLQRQNHPHLARLLPGHVRHLRWAVWLVWGVPVLVTGGVVAMLGGDVWLALLLSGLSLSLMTAFVRWPLSFLLLFVLPPAVVPLWQSLPWAASLTQALVAQWHVRPLPLTLSMLAVLSLFQVRLIGDGRAAHVRRYEGMQRLIESMKDGAGGFNPRHQGRWGQRINAAMGALSRRCLARLLRHPRPTPAHCLARLEYPLYGAVHWTMIVGTLGTVLLVAVGILAALSLLVPDLAGLRKAAPQLPVHWWWLGIGQLCMGLVMGQLFNMGTALQRSRKEQALLVLLPGVPQQGRLRAGLLQRHGLTMLGLAVPGLLLITLSELPGPTLLLQGMGLGAVLASPLLLRSWATQRSAGQGPLVLVMGAVTLAWQVLPGERLPVPVALAVMGGLLSLVALVWFVALRRMRSEPLAALPMGRRAA